MALAAWLVPGLGHALLGQWRAATLMMGSILALYCGGLALTDFTAVDAELHGLEFIAHVFAGGPTALALWLTEGHEPTRFLPYLDIGRLYVAVASLLNLVAVTDALEKGARQNHQYDTWRSRHQAMLQAATSPAPLEVVATGQEDPRPESHEDGTPSQPPTGLLTATQDAPPSESPPPKTAPFGATPPEEPFPSSEENAS